MALGWLMSMLVLKFAATAYIIVRRRDCELKRPNMFKKTLLERQIMARTKRSLAAYVQAKRLGDIPLSAFWGHRMLSSGVPPKMY